MTTSRLKPVYISPTQRRNTVNSSAALLGREYINPQISRWKMFHYIKRDLKFTFQCIRQPAFSGPNVHNKQAEARLYIPNPAASKQAGRRRSVTSLEQVSCMMPCSIVPLMRLGQKLMPGRMQAKGTAPNRRSCLSYQEDHLVTTQGHQKCPRFRKEKQAPVVELSI